MTENEIVRRARERFDPELHTARYKKIHADDAQRDRLIRLMDVQPQRRYIDLGTGNGYIAFELARRFPESTITGIDIAENSISKNQTIAGEQAMKHVNFQAYGGMELPVADSACHGVVSRYAFHHFPKPQLSAREIDRITDRDGFFVLADPVSNDDDTTNFVDRFQQMEPDGHVCFYPVAERERIFREAGFYVEEQFFTHITYPRPMGDRYAELFEATPQHILDSYNIDVREDKVWITVTVANTKFQKS